MKKLHFQYEMGLEFDRDVTGHHFLLRMKPMETERQRLVEFDCCICPETCVYEVEDGFGNRGLTGTLQEPHDRLSVKAEGVVEIRDKNPGGFHPMYRYPSRYTEPDAGIREFLRETELESGRTPGTPEGLLCLMNRLYGRFVYVPGATSVKTTAAEALAGGRGVCQDYAHIFISLCRLAGVPARYVAGMMLGEGATHAWVEIWTGQEWRGLDPTHNCPVDDKYIKLTHGRDFGDGAVDKGCFLGGASQTQRIYVKVEEQV